MKRKNKKPKNNDFYEDEDNRTLQSDEEDEENTYNTNLNILKDIEEPNKGPKNGYFFGLFFRLLDSERTTTSSLEKETDVSGDSNEADLLGIKARDIQEDEETLI